jgi:hypothetical protein
MMAPKTIKKTGPTISLARPILTSETFYSKLARKSGTEFFISGAGQIHDDIEFTQISLFARWQAR